MSKRVTDPRFATLHNDPRFVQPKRRDRKIAVDKRFSHMLKDKDFSAGAKVDKYGRKLTTNKGAREIEKFYDLEEDDPDEEPASEERDLIAKQSSTGTDVSRFGTETADVEEEEEDGANSSSEEELVALYDPARGEGLESSDDEEDDEELPDEALIEGRDLADPDPETEIPTGEVTRRFAIVNLDWDNLRAADLYVAMSSFKPKMGSVRSVSLYPSEFGKSRMAKEDTAGPPKAIFGQSDPDEDGDMEMPVNAKTIVKEDKGEEFDNSKLRKYQLERLRYYYAIVECDSAETAKHIYDACDGAEFEASANFFDLRFVPDETTFDDKPRDQCTSLPANYEPNEFVTDALQHSKVKLTWDDDDPQKAQFAKKAFSRAEIDDMELRAYLASSDSEGEEDTSALKSKYMKLLKAGDGDSEDEKPTGDMEITFAPGLVEQVKEIESEDETTIEKYKRKEFDRKRRRKEQKGALEDAAEVKTDLGFDDPFFNETTTGKSKKKEKKNQAETKESAAAKAELELLMMEEQDETGRNHFDMKNIIRVEKAKGKKRRGKKAEEREGLQDDFEMDVADPRFAAMYDSHHFAIDPTNPQFKKTGAMQKVLEERRKRNRDEQVPEERGKKKGKRSAEEDGALDKLVSSVKSKSRRSNK